MCPGVPLLPQRLDIWNKGFNLNILHEFCHCSSLWSVGIGSFYSSLQTGSWSYCPGTFNFSPRQTLDDCQLSISENLDSCILSRLFSRVVLLSKRKLDLAPLLHQNSKLKFLYNSFLSRCLNYWLQFFNRLSLW